MPFTVRDTWQVMLADTVDSKLLRPIINSLVPIACTGLKALYMRHKEHGAACQGVQFSSCHEKHVWVSGQVAVCTVDYEGP